MSENEYINVENFSNTMREVGKVVATTLNAVINAFKELANNVMNGLKNINFYKKISRKRFIKLLMSYGIQRNDANKIANHYHKKDGCYLLINVYMEVKEWKKKSKKY